MSKRLLPLFTVLLLAPVGVLAQGKAAYPDTADGLKKMMEDAIAAAKANEMDKLGGLVKSLKLPNHEAWFKGTFGDDVGAKLAKEYGERLDKFEEEVTGLFTDTVKKNRVNVTAYRIDKPDSDRATGLQKDALTAMKRPTALYTVKLIEPGKDAGTSVWSFVYVDGGFRLAGKMRAVK